MRYAEKLAPSESPRWRVASTGEIKLCLVCLLALPIRLTRRLGDFTGKRERECAESAQAGEIAMRQRREMLHLQRQRQQQGQNALTAR